MPVRHPNQVYHHQRNIRSHQLVAHLLIASLTLDRPRLHNQQQTQATTASTCNLFNKAAPVQGSTDSHTETWFLKKHIRGAFCRQCYTIEARASEVQWSAPVKAVAAALPLTLTALSIMLPVNAARMAAVYVYTVGTKPAPPALCDDRIQSYRLSAVIVCPC